MMTFKGKFILAVGMVVLLTAGMSAWKFADIYSEAQKEQLKQHTVRQADAIQRLVQQKIDLEGQTLEGLFAQEASHRIFTNNNSNSGFLSPTVARGPYLMLSFLNLASTGQWQMQWVSMGKEVSEQWRPEDFTSLIARLPLARVNDAASVIWTRVESPRRQPMLAVMKQVSFKAASSADVRQGIAIGFLPVQHFAVINELFKGQTDELFVVDDRGYALSYPSQQYLGAKLSEHPVVAAVVEQQQLKGLGEFKNLEHQPVVAAYSRLNNSNLYVVASSPYEAKPALLKHFYAEISIGALAIWIIFSALVIVLLDPTQKAMTYLKQVLLGLSENQPVGLPQKMPAEIMQLSGVIERLQQDRATVSDLDLAPASSSQPLEEQGNMQAYKKIGRGLYQSLKGPVAAVLGHAQLARSKSNDEALKQHFVVMEREARQARDIIEHLARFVNDEAELDNNRLEMREVTLAALASVRGMLESKGIRVIKKLSSPGVVIANSSRLQTAIEQLLSNAAESMVESESKELTLALEEVDGKACLTVQDTGRGIAADLLGKVFDPFYSTKESEEGSGLGLTVAKEIVKAAKGSLSVESEVGKGTRFKVDLPLVSTQRLVQVKDDEAEDRDIDEDEAFSSVQLGGVAPLTGSHLDELPVAPADDEVTLVGEEIETEITAKVDIEREASLTSPSLLVDEISVAQLDNTTLEPGEEVEDDSDLDDAFEVAIRKPKVRVES